MKILLFSINLGRSEASRETVTDFSDFPYRRRWILERVSEKRARYLHWKLND